MSDGVVTMDFLSSPQQYRGATRVDGRIGRAARFKKRYRAVKLPLPPCSEQVGSVKLQVQGVQMFSRTVRCSFPTVRMVFPTVQLSPATIES